MGQLETSPPRYLHIPPPSVPTCRCRNRDGPPPSNVKDGPLCRCRDRDGPGRKFTDLREGTIP
eukprot:5073693-Amphidinium_carterae.1